MVEEGDDPFQTWADKVSLKLFGSYVGVGGGE